MRLPHRGEMRPIPLQCMQSYSVIPFKQVRSFDLLNGSRDSPEEPCHQSTRTLRLKTYANFPDAPQEEASLSN
ncbi:unnamed protein product, partial [Rangifer tarandus platyrhynchus]